MSGVLPPPRVIDVSLGNRGKRSIGSVDDRLSDDPLSCMEELFRQTGVRFDGVSDDSAALNEALRLARMRNIRRVDCRGRTVKVVAGPVIHPGEMVLANLTIDYSEVEMRLGRFYGLGARGRLTRKIPLAADARFQGHDLILNAPDGAFDLASRQLTIDGVTFRPLDYVKVATWPPILQMSAITEASTFIPLGPPAEVARMRPFGFIQVQRTWERIAYDRVEISSERCGVHVRMLGGVSGRGAFGTRATACSASPVGEYDTGRFHLGHNRLHRKGEWGQITQIEPCAPALVRLTLSTSLVERAGYEVSQRASVAKIHPDGAVWNCDVEDVVLIGSPTHRTPSTVREVGAYFSYCHGRLHRIESRRSGWRALEYQDCLHLKIMPRVEGKSEHAHDPAFFHIGIGLFGACQWMSIDLSVAKDTFGAVHLVPIAIHPDHDHSGQPTHIQVMGGQFMNSSSIHQDAHHAWQIDGGARYATFVGCSAINAATGLTFRGADNVTFVGSRLSFMNNRGVGIVDSHTLFNVRIEVDVGPRSHRGGGTVLTEPLTHHDILAIEAGRPPVVSVSDACALTDGDQVTISGVSHLPTVYEVEARGPCRFALYRTPGVLRTGPNILHRRAKVPAVVRTPFSYSGGGVLSLAHVAIGHGAGLIDLPDQRVAALMARIGDEIVSYEAVDSTFERMLCVRRGQQGTTPRAHPAGTPVVPFGRRGYEVFNIDLRDCKLYRPTADAPATLLAADVGVGMSDHPATFLSGADPAEANTKAATDWLLLENASAFGSDDDRIVIEIEGEDAERHFESEIVSGTLLRNRLIDLNRGLYGTSVSPHHAGALVLRYAPAVSNVAVTIRGEMDHDSWGGRIQGYTPVHGMLLDVALTYDGASTSTSPAVKAQAHMLRVKGDWSNFATGVVLQGRRQVVMDFCARMRPGDPAREAVRVTGDSAAIVNGVIDGYAGCAAWIMTPGGHCEMAGVVSLDGKVPFVRRSPSSAYDRDVGARMPREVEGM